MIVQSLMHNTSTCTHAHVHNILHTYTHTHTQRYTMVFIFFGFSFAVHLLALPLLVPLMWKFKASVSHNAELFWLMALPLLVLVHAVLPGLLCKYRIIIATGYTKSMEWLFFRVYFSCDNLVATLWYFLVSTSSLDLIWWIWIVVIWLANALCHCLLCKFESLVRVQPCPWLIRSNVCFTIAVSACAHQPGQIKETVQIYQTPFGVGSGHHTIFFPYKINIVPHVLEPL